MITSAKKTKLLATATTQQAPDLAGDPIIIQRKLTRFQTDSDTGIGRSTDRASVI